MKTIATLCGSTRSESRNLQLLNAIKDLHTSCTFIFVDIAKLPLYHPFLDRNPLPEEVQLFKSQIRSANALIISTPEYLSNIPAVLKNALEWLKSGGEISQKKVLPIVFTPKAPRGEKAMKSLCWSLNALDTQFEVQLILHHSDFTFEDGSKVMKGVGIDHIEEALALTLH